MLRKILIQKIRAKVQKWLGSGEHLHQRYNLRKHLSLIKMFAKIQKRNLNLAEIKLKIPFKIFFLFVTREIVVGGAGRERKRDIG
jgi:hypothetical protein